jgi:hypothetical protein
MPTFFELQAMFAEMGIDPGHPGFYDQAAFMAAERRDASFIKTYAQYVEAMPLDEAYLGRARETARDIADFLFEELTLDGRNGACIDISGTAMRMLERKGIWSYMMDGALTIDFPQRSGMERRYFLPLVHPNNPAKTGHAWLRVPPFRVLDISLPLQKYRREEREYLREYVAAEIVEPTQRTTIRHLMEDEAIEYFVHFFRRLPNLNDLPRIAPGLREFMAEFQSFELTHNECRLRYIPIHASAMDAPLERMRNLCLRGHFPADLYRTYQERLR